MIDVFFYVTFIFSAAKQLVTFNVWSVQYWVHQFTVPIVRFAITKNNKTQTYIYMQNCGM